MAGNQAVLPDFTVGEIGHSAFSALADDEVRRWEDTCRGLEASEAAPWPDVEARALMDTVLTCLFGADLARVDAPAREWARTNRTMALFVRRLGCLRELISQESLINGPESFDRAQEVFDRVTIVGTEMALAELVGPDAQGGATGTPAGSPPIPRDALDTPTTPGRPPAAPPTFAGDGAAIPVALLDGAALSEIAFGVGLTDPVLGAAFDDPELGPQRVDEPTAGDAEPDPEVGGAGAATGPDAAPWWRRRRLALVLAAAVMAFVAGLALAGASSSGPRHHGRGANAATTGRRRAPGTPGTPTGHGPGGTPTAQQGSAAGTGAPSSSAGAPVEKGPASGRPGAMPSGQGATGGSPGGSGGGPGTGTGSGTGSGAGTGTGTGTHTVNLPGGGSVTIPDLTLPGGTQVTTPPVSVPGDDVGLPGGAGLALPGVTIPGL